MAEKIGIRELLEAGVHFGHQTRRWNPKMRRFIYGESDGIYIIDLLKTEALLSTRRSSPQRVGARGGSVLFVGTKKQARDSIKETAEAAGMPYVNHRWLGGLLTNFQTISQRHQAPARPRALRGARASWSCCRRASAWPREADLAKLRANLGGVKHMQRTPDAMFVVDLKTEAIAVQARRSACASRSSAWSTPTATRTASTTSIPGNDDAIQSCALITRAIGDVIAGAAHAVFRAEEEQRAQGGRGEGPPRGRGARQARGRGAAPSARPSRPRSARPSWPPRGGRAGRRRAAGAPQRRARRARRASRPARPRM